MLCSKCSEMIRPVIAVDIDGTLGDYHTHFMNFAIAWLGLPRKRISVFSGKTDYKEWFCKTFDVDLSTFRRIKTAYRAGGMKRTMPVYDGASDFMWTLNGFAEVWLTTTRPYNKFDGIDDDTRHWLGLNSIPFDKLLYDEDKYVVLAERVDPERVIMVLDDEIEQVNRAWDVFNMHVPVLRTGISNASAPRRPGTAWVPDLLLAGQMARARHLEWREDQA